MMGADEASRKRLLIVDDEPDIVSMLDAYFTGAGYDTVCAGSADEVLAVVNDVAANRAREVAEQAGAADAWGAADAAAVGPSGHTAATTGRAKGSGPTVSGAISVPHAALGIDLVLLDVNLPGMDGFELCRRIREHLACPIIFLTARVEDSDQLDGFAAGGDDYVLKPFSLAVLGGRVRAHLAREARRPPVAESVRIFSEVTVDFGRRVVTVRPAGTREPVELDLTRTEFDIVALLAKNPGRVYDRLQIYERVWGWDAEGDPGIVREHVRRIRRKFAETGATEDPIGTVWGIGYQWVAR